MKNESSGRTKKWCGKLHFCFDRTHDSDELTMYVFDLRACEKHSEHSDDFSFSFILITIHFFLHPPIGGSAKTNFTVHKKKIWFVTNIVRVE